MSFRGSCRLSTRQFKVPSWETPSQNSWEWLLANYGQNTDNSIDKQGWKQNVKTWDTMQLDAVLYLFLVHSSVANLITRDRYADTTRTSITLRLPGRIILLASLIPLLISLYLVLGNVRCNLRHCFKSVASNWCLRFWQTVLHSVCLCCCPYFGRNSCAVTPEICYGVSQKATANFTQRASLKTAASRRPGRRKHSLAPFIIAIVVFFLACNVVKNYLILRIMFVSDRVSDTVAVVVTILLVASSAVNPLVYAFLKRDIKRELKGLIYGRGSVKT